MRTSAQGTQTRGYTSLQTAAPAQPRWQTMRVQEILAGYGFVLPALISLTIFLIIPILASLALVFMEYDVLSPPRWAGMANLQELFDDKRLLTMYWNTARFVFFATLFNNLLGLLLAMGVNRAMPGVMRYLLRTALFFPVLTTTASLALVWNFLLTQDRGVVNYLLQQVGLEPVPWLSSSKWAMVSVVMFDVWRACGYLMVIYLAGLQGIPAELYEAAEIDGANQLQRARYVTLPLITPTAFFAIIISLLGAAQVFDNVWVLTGGGPGDASRLIVLYIYEIGFKRFKMGYAATVSLTLFIVLVTLTLIQFRASQRWVHYD
ncbi:MAG TPA: sugar ABC transporter permease [Caldilineaceae bacterium]|nr:sugar ABC transporter permease [Caldilineaceae bacterium]